MATYKHLRSSTANKRPTTSITDGQLAINTNTASPGLFFKDSAGTGIVKVGPVHVGTTAPNATPAAGGSSGNYLGEQWLDTSVSPAQMKVWNGSAWVGIVADELPVSKLQDGDARQLLQTDAAGTGVEWTSNVDVPGTLDVTGAATFDSTATVGGSNVVTVGDTGTVTSAMIANGTIVNEDVNAAAAIAGTKIDPDFGSQTVETTGIFSAAGGSAAAPSIAFTGDTNTGIYSPGADQVAVATSGTELMRYTSDAYVRLASGTGGIQFNGDTAAANALDDYEEGTWTPDLQFGGAKVGMTYAVQSGTYTKIGKLVYVIGLIGLSNKGSSTGTATVAGLPFNAPITGGASNGGGGLSYWSSFVTAKPEALATGNASISLYADGTSTGPLTDANFANFTYMFFYCTYQTT
jgi:hypothetical protein